LQCPGITFALLCTPKNTLRDVLHAHRTHRVRQRSESSLQRILHGLDQIGRKRGVRKIFHLLSPVRSRDGAYRDNLPACHRFPTRSGLAEQTCAIVLTNHYPESPMRRAPTRSQQNRSGRPLQIRIWTKRVGISTDDLQRMIGKVDNSIAAVSKQVGLPRAPRLKPLLPAQINSDSLSAVQAEPAEFQSAAAISAN
jgi:hypothetical protein